MYVLLLEYSKEWYPNWDKTGVNGKKPHPLCLKVLGCLRILAKGATFDNVYELNEISAEVNRVFFHSWTAKVVQVLGPHWIKIPTDEADIERITSEYASNGFPGCIGSIDCVHIRWDNCPAQWRNLYKGKNSYPTILDILG